MDNRQSNSLTLNFGVSPAKGPDGRTYVSVTVAVGLVSFTFGMPQEQALDWLKGFNEAFRAAQRDAS